MDNSAKPWLTYGLGDGRDKVVHEPKKLPKKYWSAVLCFFLFNGIGGHRLYVGEYKAAFKWFWICLGMQLIQLPLYYYQSQEPFPIYAKIYGAGVIVLAIFIIVKEFRTIRPSVERVNKEIESENAGK